MLLNWFSWRPENSHACQAVATACHGLAMKERILLERTDLICDGRLHNITKWPSVATLLHVYQKKTVKIRTDDSLSRTLAQPHIHILNK